MNFKRQAEQLEKLLEEAFKSKLPLITLKDNSLVYKTYRIKQNEVGHWDLKHFRGDKIDTFKLKATACLAAKFYDNSQYKVYNRIKNLDTEYWTNALDSLVFRQRFKESKDVDKKDIYFARYSLTHQRAKVYKEEIVRMFSYNF